LPKHAKRKGAKRRKQAAFAAEQHCHSCEQKDSTVKLRVNPYAAEICGDSTEHYICDDCYYRMAEEI